MKIFVFDLGTQMGWAYWRDGNLMSGSESFASQRHEGAGMRAFRFGKWLEWSLGQYGKPDFVYFEEVRRHKGVAAAHVYGGFMNILMAWCERHQIQYSSVPVQVIKRAATGKPAATKKMMIAAAVKTWGVFPADDNEADALGLLSYAKEQHPDFSQK